VLFISTQQVQPAFIMELRQSQQAWIISQHLGSPLVQVIETPSLVISHLHMPMVRLQQQTIMPFIMQQQLHMPPASIVHRSCTVLQVTLSAQEQVIFMPPVHFSTFTVQRGTIIQLAPIGMLVGAPTAPAPMPGMLIPGIAIPVRSIITLDMVSILSRAKTSRRPWAGRELPKPDLRALRNWLEL
jgi:hypothetical protein